MLILSEIICWNRNLFLFHYFLEIHDTILLIVFPNLNGFGIHNFSIANVSPNCKEYSVISENSTQINNTQHFSTLKKYHYILSLLVQNNSLNITYFIIILK